MGGASLELKYMRFTAITNKLNSVYSVYCLPGKRITWHRFTPSLVARSRPNTISAFAVKFGQRIRCTIWDKIWRR